ncbi:MAG: ABC transporter substrate-binding protein, partial [Oscillospiraceae bacterium]|nr:ABC transporter substrate-binding protein [Oscillospiraceae bacterium]
GMLQAFGCVNIADNEESLLSELSMEAIVKEDPDYIFISCMGDLEEGQAQLEATLISNPIWNTLQAVQNGRVFYLEKELFHNKPNTRWGESYEILAELLSK